MLSEEAIVEGPFWHEPVKVKKIERFGGRIRIVGATIYSNDHVDTIITERELEKITIKNSDLDFSGKGSFALLALEAIRFKYASLFDPLLAVNTSKIDPLPFQIEAVYEYILKLPRIRFLIADDPGAGKTIMAGLVIKELKLRGLVKRILIVVPGHLKDQWRRELKEKFDESFVIIDRRVMDSLYGENPWQRENQVITSMDFAKREDILPSLSSVHWDLVIVDEAHKMAAYRYGDKLSKTDRYKLGEVLSKNSEHLLFLTATPHKGDPENFRLFLDLLIPGFFAKSELIKESIEKGDNPLFIRRLKEDLKDFDGRPIFTNRYPKTIKFRLSDDEKMLYNKLSEYVITQYKKAEAKKKRNNVAFALLILQRRMASSTYALLESLKRRKEKLEELLNKPEFPKKPYDYAQIEEIEDYEEWERWEKEKEWETISIAETKEELEKEIRTLEELISLANEIVKEEKEVKLKELKKALEEGFKKIREMRGNEKILIFTESKDTMEYLVEKIRSWGYLVNYIHGGMKLEERIEAEKIFRDKTQVMVATEAAGEGINLQFCHLMINYDIPWNPVRLEQRMGRIHRYGQQKDVYVFNLVAEDTREGNILAKILDKLEEIRQALGSDKVFDVIGDIFQGKNLYQLILDAVSNTKSWDEIINELDIKVDEEYIKKVREILGESLATRHINYTKIKEIAQKANENRLAPEYVEEFFKRAFEAAGGKLRKRRDGFISVYSVPEDIRKMAEAKGFSLLKEYPKVTFDKDMAFKNPDAEFVSFGHPLLETLIDWVSKKYLSELQKGAVFEDPSGKLDGVVWFFEGEVRNGKGKVIGKRIMAIYDDGKELREINPAILWDLIPVDEPQSLSIVLDRKEMAKEYSINVVESYKEELLKEIERQAEIKRKYGIKSLEKLIDELREKIFELQLEQLREEISKLESKTREEDLTLLIKNKEERLRRYIEAKENLEKEIEQEKSLSISMPKFIGAVFVKPGYSDEMVSDEEVEKIGMMIAMEYEKSQGREPKDVSKENLGYDIRSEGEGEVRYIEVKARKDEGKVALTYNEWVMANRLKDKYWLYVIANAAKEPVLYVINNPAERLQAHEKVVQFIILPDEWKKKGEKVW